MTYIKSDFIPSPAAEERLAALGLKRLTRMNGGPGWGNSVTVPEGEFTLVYGSPAEASALFLATEETAVAAEIMRRCGKAA